MAEVEWEQLAQNAAEVFGVTIIIGVRAKGTWFVHADGIEYDCGDSADGIRTITNALQERAEKAAASANAEAQKYGRILNKWKAV